MRLFATSDLHVDFRDNLALLAGLSAGEYADDALIVAGDVAHRLELLAEGLDLLARRFRQVFYVPGNHDLWVRDEGGDSVAKLHRIIELCGQIGVHTAPDWAGGVWVVPVLSWYDASLAPHTAAAVPTRRWADLRYCRWPQADATPARLLDALNDGRLPGRGCRCVTFSHFVPRRDLLPAPTQLRFGDLPSVAGSRLIEARIRAAAPLVHVFGHSHIRRDMVLDGIRYVQHHLGYPRERLEAAYLPRQIL